jgi:hypothetical protein
MTAQERFEQLRLKAYIDPYKEVEHPPIAISYGEYKVRENIYYTPIGTYGNFSFVQAPPKSKKTFFISMLAGAYLTETTKYTGNIRGHREGKRLVHFDTEQGIHHAQKVFKRVLDMSQYNGLNYDTYGLRTFTTPHRLEFIDLYLQLYGDQTGVIIIDGVADLVVDVNDIRESNEMVQRIMKWTEIYNVHIIVVIHSNFNSDKPTGHLGSFLEKKTETQIQLKVREDNDDIVDVMCKRSRSYPFEDFSFEVNKDSVPQIIDKIDDVLRIDTPF